MKKNQSYFRGRGAQINGKNKFLQNEYVQEHVEGLDEEFLEKKQTKYFVEHPKKIINKVNSPDIGTYYSMNPYQGCEHGCTYCYARNTHEYYGFSAGLDFERNIIIKKNAPETLEKQLQQKNWKVYPIMLSGNTDCYQPAERKFELTRSMLKILLKFKHPVSIITKNRLILRDLDLLKQLAQLNLVHVNLSITTLNEKTRLALEPRTSTGKMRLDTLKQLSKNAIPVNVMMAPIIPAINSDEIPRITALAADYGAKSVAYTLVRLNGSIGTIFKDWVQKNFPNRAKKIIHQIESCHGGKVNNSSYETRMKGEGVIAESIRNLFIVSRSKYFKGKTMPPLNLELFNARKGQQLSFF